MRKDHDCLQDFNKVEENKHKDVITIREPELCRLIEDYICEIAS